jgi:non-specific serine/threonine protein kinase
MADAPVKLRPGNLPAELTSFVGRRKELSEVKRLLTATRLLTLTGSGGAGKTRLALRVAAELTRNFPDGL